MFCKSGVGKSSLLYHQSVTTSQTPFSPLLGPTPPAVSWTTTEPSSRSCCLTWVVKRCSTTSPYPFFFSGSLPYHSCPLQTQTFPVSSSETRSFLCLLGIGPSSRGPVPRGDTLNWTWDQWRSYRRRTRRPGPSTTCAPSPKVPFLQGSGS